jgi:hypothetical protein
MEFLRIEYQLSQFFGAGRYVILLQRLRVWVSVSGINPHDCPAATPVSIVLLETFILNTRYSCQIVNHASIEGQQQPWLLDRFLSAI